MKNYHHKKNKTYRNINKSARVKKLEKKLRREQRCLSRKYENLKKGESTQKNIQKQKLSDRIYHCDCGYVEDRDFNAALNLRDALTYKVA